jgi:hypothetical protein
MEHDSSAVSRNRRRPRATLEGLVSHPPPRLRDRALDAVSRGNGDAPVVAHSPPEPGTTDVTYWTPIGSPDSTPDPREPRATLLAEPSLPGTADRPVAHTLVLEVGGTTASVELDYRPLDVAVVPERGVRARTDADRSIPVAESRLTDDGTFAVTFAERPADCALFLEYQVTRNPEGGRHTVDVVVDDDRRTEAGLVVVG